MSMLTGSCPTKHQTARCCISTQSAASGGKGLSVNGEGIKGEREDAVVTHESEHFEVCPVCGQAFDLRDLAQVLHHDQPEHEPLPRPA
jgi:hypothetical protein